MPTYLAVAIGGALGAAARYGVDRVLERHSPASFPLSTFAINVSGCLVVGILIAAVVDRHHGPAWLRVGLVMGVIGGYTTFSTYAQEAHDLLREGAAAAAVTYALLSVVGGILAVFAGMRLGRLL